MANFIYLPRMGYIDVDDVVQVYHPNGGALDLDSGGVELVLRFSVPIFDGNTETHVTKLTDKEEIEYVTSALGLLSCPHSIGEVITEQQERDKRRDLLKRAVSMMEELREVINGMKPPPLGSAMKPPPTRGTKKGVLPQQTSRRPKIPGTVIGDKKGGK